jgi:hypothetical protein
MRTIAQFSIRDPDAEGSVSTVGPDDVMRRRGSAQSGNAGAGGMQQGTSGSSLRHVESLTNMPVAEEGADDQLTVHTDFPRERSQSTNDATPTNEHPHGYELSDSMDYSPVDALSFDSPERLSRERPAYLDHMRASYGAPDPYDPYNEGYVGQQDSPQELQGSAAGLRVANVTSSSDSDWERDALRSLNIGR